ncbi:four helix bundle protein [Riemerella columbina]|uniref:four helix bundle protein n=1 Tax=Riemerella columbina TaxID=103810 RepID=UPI0003668195|nr:four helix bundle protein [Riemerella columbina]
MIELAKIPVYRLVFRFHIYLDRVVHTYPKKYYYMIGERIRKVNLALVEKIHAIASSKGKSQQKHFESLKKIIEKLKFYMRLSFEYQLLKEKQMIYIFSEIIRIEKQLYLWQEAGKAKEKRQT